VSAAEARKLREQNPSISPWWVVAGQAAVGLVAALAAWGLTGKQNVGWSVAYGALAVLVPAAQFPDPQHGAAFFVRGADAEAATATVKRQLTRLHPAMRVDSFILERRVQESLVRERLMAMLSGFFGVLAALLATIGLYGVMAYVMQRRRNEVGIRLALGAQPGQVVRMVMRDAAALVLCGVGVGVALSVAAGRSAETLLFGLSPTDVVTYVAAIALLTGIALIASLVPALRASRVDPMLALRQD